MNQHQIEIVYCRINNVWSYSAAYFESKIAIRFWRESGLKENSSGLMTHMHYMEIMVLQNSVTTHVIYYYSEYPLHYTKPSFLKSLFLSVHAEIYLPSLSAVGILALLGTFIFFFKGVIVFRTLQLSWPVMFREKIERQWINVLKEKYLIPSMTYLTMTRGFNIKYKYTYVCCYVAYGSRNSKSIRKTLEFSCINSIIFPLLCHLLQDLFHLTEVDLRKLGIENQGHRTHLISNILLLQEVKQKRGKISMLSPND